MFYPEKTVYISYRHGVSVSIAHAIFLELFQHGFDVFMDVDRVDSEQIDTINLNQIAARAHFVVILTPASVAGCLDPDDRLRHEIEHAMISERNIVPIMVNSFDFRQASKYLAGKLSQLPRYNALNVPHDFFDAAMDRLRERFLRKPFRPIRPAPGAERMIVAQMIAAAESQPAPNEALIAAEEYYDLAHKKWEAGDYHAVIADCTDALHLNPGFTEAYNRRGMAYLTIHDYDSALADFTQAIGLNPNHSAACFNRGLAHAAKGDNDSALADFAEVLRLDPLFAYPYPRWNPAQKADRDFHGATADYQHHLALGRIARFSSPAEVLGAVESRKGEWYGVENRSP